MGNKKAISKTIIAVIIVVIVIIAVAGAYAYLSTKHPSSMMTSMTTSSSSTTSSISNLNTSNPQVLMSLVGLSSPPSTPVTITVWNSYSVSENQAFNETLTQFEQEFPWIHVQVTYGVGVGTSQFETAAKAGQAPIVYRDTSDSGGALFAAGLVLNLSQYLPNSITSLYLPTAIKDWELNGSLYGLPDNINYIVMFYNKQFVPYPPNTTAQLVQIAEQVNKTYGVWGIAYGASDEYGYRFAAWFAGFGGQIFTTSSGKVIPDLNTTAMVDALNFWYNLTYNLKVNYLAPSTGAGGAEGQLFIANKTAIIFDGPWDLNNYLQALGPNLGAAPLPVVSQTGLRAAPFVGSTGFLIASPQASGANQMQIKAAIIFVLYFTNYEADYRLFAVAHDIPANVQAYNQALTDLKEGKLQPAYLNQIMEGILEQAQYGQKFPNIPQMAYYWNSFHQYASEFFADKINATQASQGMEQAFVQSLVQNGLLSYVMPLPIVPPVLLMVSIISSIIFVVETPKVMKKW
ncbi:sugar ABC transporter substrate-binding protein [Sulfolobus sp. A20]|uniref:extracellular solute-binding protein n=1 Tax=Saccharolobus sp. A20 TaxID=1891280 RepID=UPI000845EEBC|nr:extracellular solute-binding protein [Sulfolobus sp. A20]AOL15522.1 sugar ABC transporter substrate-binding protein [Sulfolobus sp. A20]TRM83241.1 sugar ABC transporter substrate-binding protein [Sulfolobus sp. A20-N-F6]TRM88471.1 sugar ABC transporter substrate-binding protein [Sulfolobus sp. C3]TRN03172.1 sugar ABC transporter substrate-binding protein [Sulfolobus sp. E1]